MDSTLGDGPERGASTGPFAHSLEGTESDLWEPLARHLTDTADGAATNAASFGWAPVARLAGLLHDIGKSSPEFQNYIRGGATTGPDHATAGAKDADTYGLPLSRLLALVIAGHHSGRADPETLDRRLARPIPDYIGWQAHTGPLPPKTAPVAPMRGRGSKRGMRLLERVTRRRIVQGAYMA